MTDAEYNKGIDLWADDAYRFALSCYDNEESCRDAVQDAFAALWEHRKKVAVEKGKAFLFKAVHNRLMSLFRHDRVRADMPRWETDEMPPDEGFDVRDAIDKALSTLPPLQRECLQLRDVEGYAYKEIANILNISDQQVQVYIFRARVALKKKLIILGYDNNRKL